MAYVAFDAPKLYGDQVTCLLWNSEFVFDSRFHGSTPYRQWVVLGVGKEVR